MSIRKEDTYTRIRTTTLVGVTVSVMTRHILLSTDLVDQSNKSHSILIATATMTG
jgi:hypothetical protein